MGMPADDYCSFPHQDITYETITTSLLASSEAATDSSNGSVTLVCNCSDLHSILSYIGFEGLHCEPFPFSHPLHTQLAYNFLFWTTILVALLGNFTVIWIVLRHERMRTVTNYYLLNLAVADASISIFNTGFTWSYNFYYVWRWGSFYCRVNNLMGITPIAASVFTMIVMSIDRYWAVVHPLRKRPGRRSTIAAICCIWILAFLLGLPAAYSSHIEGNYFYDNGILEEAPVCLADNFPDGDAISSVIFAWYDCFIAIVNYLIPLCVLSYAYYRVGRVLRRKETVGDCRNQRNLAAKRKASNMLAIVVLIFMVVWLPYHAYFLFVSYGGVIWMDRETAQLVYLNIYWLSMSSTLFNPIIYYFMNKRFRIGFRYAFRWLPWVRVDECEYSCLLGCYPRSAILTSILSQKTPHTTATQF